MEEILFRLMVLEILVFQGEKSIHPSCNSKIGKEVEKIELEDYIEKMSCGVGVKIVKLKYRDKPNFLLRHRYHLN